MRGSLYLAGGGSPRQEELVWRAAFDGVRRVLYWPFALSDARVADAPEWLRAALADLGIDARVDAWLSLDGHAPAEIDGVDLLFVGGGTTSKLARHVHDLGFDQAVRDHVANGGRYYGGSAGALLACESIAVCALADGDADAAVHDTGLGLVPRVTVLPHADTLAVEDQHAWSTRLGQPFLAVPEAGGVVFTGTTCTVIGPGAVEIVDGGTRTTWPPGALIPWDWTTP
ncbi:MAG: Type 1 glutamine amidotransferase-like domain-containing protein [Actinocatenispora sp.]